ncbi:MAG: ATP-dependent helicase, RecQ family [Solirubrobacterales bacterium]|nr:ATP-dependent helicase, RecQ family [Solirubrobacterales bacterium]
MSDAARIGKLAKEKLGIEKLHPGQLEAIEAVLAGRDTLAVMSTGYGKSAIYQLAGEILGKPTIVVSPLIALQRDQVEAIEDRIGDGEAAELNSTVSAKKRRELLAALERGEHEFVLLAPEQLAKPEVLAELAATKPSLLVVDEAHTISEWGHDFRPDYLQLGAFAERLGHPTILALTATASPPVRREIVERLGMRDPAEVIRGFDRPNLHFAVRRFTEAAAKEKALVEAVAAAAKPGIVYIATRRASEELAEALSAAGVNAEAYHAGLPAKHRGELQDRFMADEVEVIVATTAFGMGIDKPNVRFVFHAGPSDSIDSYYQEVGRAGRDGEPGEAVLFYRPEDEAVRHFLAGAGGVDGEDLEAVGHAIEGAGGEADPVALVKRLELSRSRVLEAVGRLEETGWLETGGDGEVRLAPGGPTLEHAIQQGVRENGQRREFDKTRLAMMRSYAETEGCRRDHILSYFGEEHEVPCFYCDNCDAGLVHPDDAVRPFPIGAPVTHKSWGSGEVQRYDRDRVVVLFESVGYRTLDLKLVEEEGLLIAR